MSVSEALLTVMVVWVVAVAAARWGLAPVLRRGPRGDAETGLMWWAVRAYCRVMHRTRYRGLELLPQSDGDHAGLIVVSNHTGSVDPLIIQSRCRFHIRWLMATDTMAPLLDWLWKWQEVIPVRRDGRDAAALREAIRHVRGGGAVGVFPEGRIAVPPREVRPFFSGVGVLIAKTQVPVLLVWVSGTPDTSDMFQALTTRSRARVEFIDVVDFGGEEEASVITERLRERISEVSGWALNDELRPPGRGEEGGF